MAEKRWPVAAGIVVSLCAAIWAVYGQVGGFEFVNLDDALYLTGNEVVQGGFTRESVVWAFTTDSAANWHPLTWLSHMLDVEMFGLDPGPAHLVNVLWHTLGVLLLFGFLLGTTGSPVRSGLAAALFALHPLHVESVAWLAERKDVLSCAFAMATLCAYAHYARRPTLGRYAGVFVLLALGLMAKPMLVTLPFLLLLLDVWPLGRLRLDRLDLPLLRRLVLEKLPLLALSLASSVVTLAVQRTAMDSLAQVPLLWRAANALSAYAGYLGRLLWPVDLAVIYPHPYAPWGVPLSGLEIGGAALLLALVTLAVARAWRRPWLGVGWLWFLGTLVPVIGLVQVGEQALADRYAYLPAIGLYVACVWLAAEAASRLAHRWSPAPAAGCALALALLCALGVRAHAQAQLWRGSLPLFRHTLAVAGESPTSHLVMGVALDRQGRSEAAMEQYQRALALKPSYAEAHYNLGVVLYGERRLDEARHALENAAALQPENGDAQNNLALVYLAMGRIDAAVAAFERALASGARPTTALVNLGNALGAAGRADEAMDSYRRALALDPDLAAAHFNLARLLGRRGEQVRAIHHFERAVTLEPERPESHYYLARALAAQARLEPAIFHLRQVLRLQPAHPRARRDLDVAIRLASHTTDSGGDEPHPPPAAHRR